MEKKNEKVVEVAEEVVEVNEEKEEITQLPIYVERTTTNKNGKKYNNYFVRSKMMGKEIKADLVASDLGGYEILDFAFSGESKKLLGIELSARKDARDKVVRYNSYFVEGVDEIGIPFRVSIRPRETSDKAYLEYIIAKEQKKLELAENGDKK